MKPSIFLLFTIAIPYCAYAMEQPVPTDTHQSDVTTTLDNKKLYELAFDSKYNNVSDLIAPYTLRSGIKNKILADMAGPTLASYKTIRAPLHKHTALISPDGKKAVLYHRFYADSLTCEFIVYDLEKHQQKIIQLHRSEVCMGKVAWSGDSQKVLIGIFGNHSSKTKIVHIEGYEIANIVPSVCIKNCLHSSIAWHGPTNTILWYSPLNERLVVYNPAHGKIIKEHCPVQITQNQDTHTSFLVPCQHNNLVCFGSHKQQILFDLELCTVKMQLSSTSPDAVCNIQSSFNTDGTKLAIVRTYGKSFWNPTGHTIEIVDLTTHETKLSPLTVQAGSELHLMRWQTTDLASLMITRKSLHDIPEINALWHIINTKTIKAIQHFMRTKKQVLLFNINDFTSTYSDPTTIIGDTNNIPSSYWIPAPYFSTIQAYKLLGRIALQCLIARDMNVSSAKHKISVEYRIYNSDACNDMIGFFNNTLPYAKNGTNRNLTLKQTLLLNAIAQTNAIGQQNALDTAAPYELNSASHAVFKTLPKAVQKALKPLVIKYPIPYYLAADGYYAAKRGINKSLGWIREAVKSHPNLMQNPLF